MEKLKFNSIKDFFDEIDNNYEKKYNEDKNNKNYCDKSRVLNNNWYYIKKLLKPAITDYLHSREIKREGEGYTIRYGLDNRAPIENFIEDIYIAVLPTKHTINSGVYLLINRNKENKKTINYRFTYSDKDKPPKQIIEMMDSFSSKHDTSLNISDNALDDIAKDKINKFIELSKENDFPSMKNKGGKGWNPEYKTTKQSFENNTLKVEILNLWKDLILNQEKGIHFNTKKEYEMRPSRAMVESFLNNPTDENFKKFWDLLYSAQQKGQSIHILKNNNIDGIRKFISDLLNVPQIDNEWVNQNKIDNTGKSTIYELFGLVNINTKPLINDCVINALNCLNYKTTKSSDYNIIEKSFKSFKILYEKEVGHVTANTNWEVPINYEIDKFFNVVDKVKTEKNIGSEATEREKILYKKVLEMKNKINVLKKGVDEQSGTSIHHITPPSNFILYGPPGTGKTYKTVDIAACIIGGSREKIDTVEKIIDVDKINSIDEEQFHKNNTKVFNAGLKEEKIHFVTFHQNYSYEEFVGGLRPDEDNEDKLRFQWKPGIFIKACAKALELATINKPNEKEQKDLEKWFLDKCTQIEHNDFQDSNKYDFKSEKVVLIIDEINRANISRVFGELITLIEGDKRIGGKHQLILTLPNGDKKFGVPANLIIMGTMNTADKSLALLDVALRRRFEFKGLFPKEELIKKEYGEILKKLNEEIRNMKGVDYQIGHSYFMGKEEVETKDDFLKKVFNKNIIPLLNEYFMNDGTKVKRLVEKVVVINKKVFEHYGVVKCNGNLQKNMKSDNGSGNPEGESSIDAN